MRRPSSRQHRLVILMLTVLTLVVAYYTGNRYQASDPPPIAGVLMRPPTPLPDFILRNPQDLAVSPAWLKGRWSLILLDPAPSNDPQALRRLIRIYNRLAARPKFQRQSRFIYIPREESEQIDQRVARLGPSFLVLGGGEDEIAEVFKRFGVDQMKQGFTLFLVDPEQRILALFTDAQDAASIDRDLQTLVDHVH